MNIEKELNNKEKELTIINNIITETLILSQEKYLEYLEEKRQLEDQIKQLKEHINKPKNEKIWIVEGEWSKRIYKNE